MDWPEKVGPPVLLSSALYPPPWSSRGICDFFGIFFDIIDFTQKIRFLGKNDPRPQVAGLTNLYCPEAPDNNPRSGLRG